MPRLTDSVCQIKKGMCQRLSLQLQKGIIKKRTKTKGISHAWMKLKAKLEKIHKLQLFWQMVGRPLGETAGSCFKWATVLKNTMYWSWDLQWQLLIYKLHSVINRFPSAPNQTVCDSVVFQYLAVSLCVLLQLRGHYRCVTVYSTSPESVFILNIATCWGLNYTCWYERQKQKHFFLIIFPSAGFKVRPTPSER